MSETERTSVRLKVDDVRNIPGIVDSYLNGSNPTDLVLLQLDSEKFPRRTMDFPKDVRKYVMTHPRAKVVWDNEFQLEQKSNDVAVQDIQKQKIVVTFTSWKERIGNCVKVIQSILNNTQKPDIVFLNLSIQEFPNLNADLPHDLVKLCMSNNSVKINWVTGSNTKTMKKVFPILQYLNDDDIIIYIDDDILYPSDYIKSRIEDFRKFNSPITGVDKWVVFKNCKPPIIGVVGATGLIQKKMLNGWEKYITKQVLDTYNDDTQYAVLCYLNGYVHHPSTKYKWDELKKYEFNCVSPSYGNGVYLMSEQIEPIVNESIMRNFGKTIQTGYGILNDKFKTMDVCYITDDNYAEITSKSIQSLASCVNPNTHYVIHVICDNVSELNKANLLLNARHNVDVKLVDYSPSQFIPKRLLENRGDKITHVTNAAMIKFNICNILSYLDTVLYVDGDVVFVNDPVTVQNFDLKDNYIGACLDDMTFESKETWMGSHVRNSSPEMYVKLHDDVILSGSPYVNSGVMYMNLKKIRMDGMDKALLDYKMKTPTFFVDQDAINMTFRGKILRLPIFYNFFRKYKTSSRGIQQVEKRYFGYSDKDIVSIHIAERGVDKYEIMDNEYKKYTGRTIQNHVKTINRFFSEYKKKWGRIPNMKNPQNLDEIWFQRYMTTKYQDKYYLADKLAVRKYVQDMGLSGILVPLIAVFDSGKVDLRKLSGQFVLKLNTGVNHNLFFRNGMGFSQENVDQITSRWLAKETYRPTEIEVHYDKITPKLFAEEYIGTKDKIPTTYEVYCSNGKPLFITVADFNYKDRTIGKSINYIQSYDIDWSVLPWYKKLYSNAPIPKNLSEILEIASTLSKDMDLLRVDLFDIDGKVYFNELTLSPGGFIFSSWNKTGIIEAGHRALEVIGSM